MPLISSCIMVVFTIQDSSQWAQGDRCSPQHRTCMKITTGHLYSKLNRWYYKGFLLSLSYASCILANLVGDVNHCSVVEYGKCVDIQSNELLSSVDRGFHYWLVLFLQIRRSFLAPLSDWLRGAGGAVSAHQPIGLYSIETTADQSPSKNNWKHPKGKV